MTNKAKAVMFVLHKNFTLATLMGHTIEFVKGEPTHVPKEAWKEATAIGAVPADELEEEVVKPKSTELDPDDRKAKIYAAIEGIVIAGVRESFTGNGSPHAAVISTAVGFEVGAKERDVVWAEFRQANKAD
jgi:hypothetical protein